MQVRYTDLALEDLRRIPKRFAAQIVVKITKLEGGLHGSIKRLANFDCDYRLRCGGLPRAFRCGRWNHSRASCAAPKGSV